MSEDRAMLPYIHTHRSYSPTLYMEEDPYWRQLRRRREYLDNYYRLHPHHSYWYDYHMRHHQHHNPLYASTSRLPRLSYPWVEEYASDPRLEAHYRFHRDRDPYCSFCKPVKKVVPSMHYDEVPCPHCDHPIKDRQKDDVMAFPWTPQTYQPRDDRSLLDLPADEPPPILVPYAQSAPPMENIKKGTKPLQPPYSSPPFPLLKPKMGLLDADERRRAVRRRPGYMSVLPEEGPVAAGNDNDDDNPQDYISPKDSISNVGLQPFRSLLFHPSRLKPSHSDYSERFYHERSRRADPTPPPLGYVRPRRRMEGQYLDIRNGRKYNYDVKYGKSGEVNSERRVVR